MPDYYERTQESKRRRRAFEKQQARKQRQSRLEQQRLQNKGAMKRTKYSQDAQTKRHEDSLGFEKKKYRNKQRDKAIQSRSDRYYMDRIGSGQLHPKFATKMSEQAQEQLMLQRPDLFPGASTSGGGGGTGSSGVGGGGGGGGLTPRQAQSEWVDSLEAARERINEGNYAGFEGSVTDEGKFVDAAGREIPRDRVIEQMAQKDYKTRLTPPGMQFGAQQQQGPGAARSWQDMERGIEARNLANRENFEENTITSMVDEQGNPVDASNIEREEGGQHYGVTPEGKKVYRKFSLSGTGRKIPGEGPTAESVRSVGFGDQRREVAGRGDEIQNVIDRVFEKGAAASPDSAREGRKETIDTTPTGVGKTVQQARGEGEQKGRATGGKEGGATEQARAEKEKPAVPKNINRQKLKELASSPPEETQEPSTPQQAIYGKQEWRPSPIATGAQNWMNQNMPESVQQFGEDTVAFELRKAGLGENLTDLKQMSRNLRLRYPNASPEEIAEMVKKAAKENKGKK